MPTIMIKARNMPKIILEAAKSGVSGYRPIQFQSKVGQGFKPRPVPKPMATIAVYALLSGAIHAIQLN